ncbi:hypothetical protein LRP31_23580 [Mesorhizobium mediterraneum]|uniref:PRTase-CE domain-containing protein n=1 Tax=Mesorhizobium mediterraneum TaxID=43617 RepID=A0AB36QZS5_9HYPH|nr:hypothetical protein [Mesorhizobium mediterraneum]PAP97796.1 hypothetical protein CIT25_34995 [Mesorhizobium mediterraneum]RWN38725.1 MAG: hypothetical protein EOR96_22045 [Mesorhizobium sp.]WIW52028.1 hypothetical protein LRP31_23580 [Mesorhizobium mediterraneum]
MSDVDLISEKIRYFRLFQIWPLAQRFDTVQWRQNFLKDELVFADRLLDRFVYFSDIMVNSLLVGAVRRFFDFEYFRLGSAHAVKNANYAFVYVEGEVPNPSDSGYSFMRRIRDNLRVEESRLVSPDQAILRKGEFDTFVFVDDFVGSGNQMIDTWQRPRRRADGSFMSFADLASAGHHTFAYCPCLCTSYGKSNLTIKAPKLQVVPAHLLSESHNASSANSLVWAGLNVSEGIDFLKIAAKRAGFVCHDGGENDWRGFHKLGLSVGFHDTIPDACLPIYFSTLNGWRPLMKRGP